MANEIRNKFGEMCECALCLDDFKKSIVKGLVALEGERCRGCDNILQECECIDNDWNSKSSPLHW